MSNICKRFMVNGKVQGVFFRDATCKQANQLDITGWVRNLSDGRVEVLACGLAANLDIFESWLWEGTPASNVEKVTAEETPLETHSGFVIKCSDEF